MVEPLPCSYGIQPVKRGNSVFHVVEIFNLEKKLRLKGYFYYLITYTPTITRNIDELFFKYGYFSRFRSIAKSYFRRADGVLLLYDCSYERSFMSVREWVDSIEASFYFC